MEDGRWVTLHSLITPFPYIIVPMTPLNVLTMIFTAPQHPAIMVMEPEEASPVEGAQRVLPIWIGPQEAMQVGAALEHIKMPRPFTHDLFLDALTNLDARVDHVVISDVSGQTYFAKLYLRQGSRLIELDARPTDAISLAIREGAPIYAEERVLDAASFPFILKEGADKELELKEFDRFIEGLDPEDLL